MTYKEDRAVNYTNQFGESVQIAASDEIWLNDEFFAREMAKLPTDAPRAGLAYRRPKGRWIMTISPCKKSSAGNSARSMAGAWCWKRPRRAFRGQKYLQPNEMPFRN